METTYKIRVEFCGEESEWFILDSNLESCIREWVLNGCRILQITNLQRLQPTL